MIPSSITLEAAATSIFNKNLERVAQACKVINPDGSISSELIDFGRTYQVMAQRCGLSKPQASKLLALWAATGFLELIQGHGIRILKLPEVTI